MGMSPIHPVFCMCKKYWCVLVEQDPLSLMPLPGIRKVSTFLTFSSVQFQFSTVWKLSLMLVSCSIRFGTNLCSGGKGKKNSFPPSRNQLPKNNTRFSSRQVYQLDLKQQRMCKNLVLKTGSSGICILYCQKHTQVRLPHSLRLQRW